VFGGDPTVLQLEGIPEGTGDTLAERTLRDQHQCAVPARAQRLAGGSLGLVFRRKRQGRERRTQRRRRPVQHQRRNPRIDRCDALHGLAGQGADDPVGTLLQGIAVVGVGQVGLACGVKDQQRPRGSVIAVELHGDAFQDRVAQIAERARQRQQNGDAPRRFDEAQRGIAQLRQQRLGGVSWVSLVPIP